MKKEEIGDYDSRIRLQAIQKTPDLEANASRIRGMLLI